jgi:GNAT superfamily N-acetyltransferase
VEISTDRDRVDRDAVHRFLAEDSYWAAGVTREVVDRSIDESLAFGLFVGGEQAGFARAVTDGATFAWIADVFVLPAHRGRGLGKRLVEAVLAHPDVVGARRVLLGTQDAHGLYARYGFEVVDHPERYLLLRRPGREPGC